MKLPQTDEEIMHLAQKAKHDKDVTDNYDTFCIATYKGMVDLLTITSEKLADLPEAPLAQQP